MKLITLNIWGARIREPFIDFIKKNKDVDIFCFQELYDKATEKLSDDEKEGRSGNIFTEIGVLLPNHQGFFRPVKGGVYGIGSFVKKNIKIIEEGEIRIHTNTEYPEDTGHHSRNLQWLELQMGTKTYSIFNVHGLWNGNGKNDTQSRLVQSKNIKTFMDSINAPKILCGDFNLRPDTESIEIAGKGMRNLIKEFGVTTTRTSLYMKPEKFADYIFTSPEIAVNHFEVMPDEVSDHTALLLDFD